MKTLTVLIVGIVVGIIIGLSNRNDMPVNGHFVWNDDIESLPMEGSLIRLEYTGKDGEIYIGPAE